MMHPATELRLVNERIGYGVFSTRAIPKGTITWTLDALDRLIEPAELAAFPAEYRGILDKYSYRDRFGRHVLCWDHARFVNHDSDPNCLMTAYEFEIAVRDVAAGEQLTDDYGCLNVCEPFPCESGGRGRTVVQPDDLVRYHADWDGTLRRAFARFGDVDQPLLPLLTARRRAQAIAVSRGEIEMESVLSCYFDGSVPGA